MAEEPASARTKQPVFHRARMEYGALVAQLVSAIAVIVSLVFVGLQLSDSNRVAVRVEANSTQEQWTAFNASIYGSSDTAAILQAALSGGRPLDAVEQLRFAYLLREQGWLTYQGWERVRAGLRPRASFYDGAGLDFVRVICTPGGRVAWPQVRTEFPAGYVADLDRLTQAHARTRPGACPVRPER